MASTSKPLSKIRRHTKLHRVCNFPTATLPVLCFAVAATQVLVTLQCFGYCWAFLGIKEALSLLPRYKHPHSTASEGLCMSLVLLIKAQGLRTSNSKVYWFSALKMKKLLQEANDQQDWKTANLERLSPIQTCLWKMLLSSLWQSKRKHFLNLTSNSIKYWTWLFQSVGTSQS